MAYLKKPITAVDLDSMRIALSVLSRKLRPEPSCDFCGSSSPVVVYASVQLSTGEFVANWRWCACRDCERDVDADNWKAVELRLLLWLKPKFPGISKRKLRIVVKHVLWDFHLYAERTKAGTKGC